MTSRDRPVLGQRGGLFCWQCPKCGTISAEFAGIPDAAFSASLHRCPANVQWRVVQE